MVCRHRRVPHRLARWPRRDIDATTLPGFAALAGTRRGFATPSVSTARPRRCRRSSPTRRRAAERSAHLRRSAEPLHAPARAGYRISRSTRHAPACCGTQYRAAVRSCFAPVRVVRLRRARRFRRCGGEPHAPVTTCIRCCPMCRGSFSPRALRDPTAVRTPLFAQPALASRLVADCAQRAAPSAAGGVRGPPACRALIARLSGGLYRRSLMVITADHGSRSSWAVDRRASPRRRQRGRDRAGAAVRQAAGPARGRVSAACDAGTDVVPTIADAAGPAASVAACGRRRVRRHGAARAGVSIASPRRRGRGAVTRPAMERRRRGVREARAAASARAPGAGVSHRARPGPADPQGAGDAAAALRPPEAAFDLPRRIWDVDPARANVPTWAVGKATRRRVPERGPADLALAVNGSIRAVGRQPHMRGRSARVLLADLRRASLASAVATPC